MEGKQRGKVLLVTHVSGFVPQFEMNNVRILQSMGYEVHYASNFNTPSYGRIIAVWMERGLSAIRLILCEVRLISGICMCIVRWLS